MMGMIIRYCQISVYFLFCEKDSQNDVDDDDDFDDEEEDPTLQRAG